MGNYGGEVGMSVKLLNSNVSLSIYCVKTHLITKSNQASPSLFSLTDWHSCEITKIYTYLKLNSCTRHLELKGRIREVLGVVSSLDEVYVDGRGARHVLKRSSVVSDCLVVIYEVGEGGGL